MPFSNIPTRTVEVVKLRAVITGRYVIVGRSGAGTQYIAPEQVPKALREAVAQTKRKQVYAEAYATRAGRWQLRGLAADQEQKW